MDGLKHSFIMYAVVAATLPWLLVLVMLPFGNDRSAKSKF